MSFKNSEQGKGKKNLFVTGRMKDVGKVRFCSYKKREMKKGKVRNERKEQFHREKMKREEWNKEQFCRKK